MAGEDTWENRENLENAKELVEEFKREHREEVEELRQQKQEEEGVQSGITQGIHSKTTIWLGEKKIQKREGKEMG